MLKSETARGLIDIEIGQIAHCVCFVIQAVKGNNQKKENDCKKCCLDDSNNCRMFLCDKRERRDRKNVYFARVPERVTP